MADPLPTTELRASIEKLRQSAEEFFNALERVQRLASGVAKERLNSQSVYSTATNAAPIPAHDHDDGGPLLEGWQTLEVRGA